jgi:Tfp pilus assembly protein PilV
MLLELLIAIVVLAIGMGGLIPLLVSSMYTNNRSGADTSAVMVAEHVLEQISAQPANSSAALTVTDCAGTNWTIGTGGATLAGGTGGAYGGNGANLTSNGTIDWTQTYAAVPANYKMQYVACGNGGRQTTFEARWDVITMTNYTRMVIISARPTTALNGIRYIVPVNLRTIGGM